MFITAMNSALKPGAGKPAGGKERERSLPAYYSLSWYRLKSEKMGLFAIYDDRAAWAHSTFTAAEYSTIVCRCTEQYSYMKYKHKKLTLISSLVPGHVSHDHVLMLHHHVLHEPQLITGVGQGTGQDLVTPMTPRLSLS